MLKHKITSIIIGSLMLSGVVIGVNTINNTKIINDNTKVVNKVLLSAPTSTNERAVVVNTDNSPLVLYSSASASSNITSYISVGEMLTIQASGDNFYKVKVQETGAVGYISANNIQIITSGVNDSYNEVNKQGDIINVSSRVNLRANATMNSNILAKLSNNTKIDVLGKQGKWYKVNYNGTIGYIYQEYIGLTNANLSSNKNLNNSKSSASTSVQSNTTNKVKSNNSSSNINTKLFSNEYQNLYNTLKTKALMYYMPGPYMVANLNLSTTVDGTKYYYLYAGSLQPIAMGVIPSPEGTYGYISLSGKKLDSKDLTPLINQFNSLSNKEKYKQIYQIATQYIVDNAKSKSLNKYVPKLDIDLNKTIVKDGQTLYSVTYTPTQGNGFKDPTAQLYVSGTGFVYLPNFYENFAKIFANKDYYITWTDTNK